MQPLSLLMHVDRCNWRGDLVPGYRRVRGDEIGRADYHREGENDRGKGQEVWQSPSGVVRNVELSGREEDEDDSGGSGCSVQGDCEMREGEGEESSEDQAD